MLRILIITHCHDKSSTLGKIISKRFNNYNVKFTLISKAKTGIVRFIDVLIRGFFHSFINDIILIDVFAYRAFVYDSLAILYGKIASKRIIAYVHDGSIAEYIDSMPRWYKFILSLPDVLITPNDYLGSVLEQRGIKVHQYIPNFIDQSKYTLKLREKLKPKFLYMRGMDALYNPQMAVKAFAIVQDKYPDASISFVSNKGKQTDSCKKLVNELGLKNVKFKGKIEKEKVGNLISDYDIYLNTNNVDNMPVTIIEVWATGLPIIATNVGGIPYIMQNEENGILVEPNDYKAMGLACLRLLKSPDLVLKLTSRGLLSSKEYLWQNISPLWKEVLGIR